MYTDDVLSEYIMVLLHGGNSKEKIYEELVIFMNSPEVAEHFVLWLFGEVERLGQVSVASGQNNQNVIPESAQIQTYPDYVEVSDIQMTSTNSTSNNSSSARIQGTRNFSKALEGAINPNHRTMNTDSHSTRNNSHNQSYTPSAATSSSYSSRVSGSSRSRSNRSVSPQRTSSTTRRVVRSSQDDSLKVQKIRVAVDFDRDERRRGNITQNSNNQSNASLTHKSSYKKQGQVQVESDQDQNTQDTSDPALLPNKIKVKCQYWPNCRAGEACPNVHPTETCKHFPNCQFGDDCTFVHPSIPCKFQGQCQNPLCNYQHRPTAFTVVPPSAASSGTSTILCKFYPRCVNINCPYLHPVKTQCRYGVDCSRPDCPFEHASGRKGAHLKSVVFAPCKYGKQCARADCPYQHTDESVAMNLNVNGNMIPDSMTSNSPTITSIDSTDMQS